MSNTFIPTQTETDFSEKLLAAMVKKGILERPRLIFDGENRELPPQLAFIFRQVAEDFSKGKSITLIAHEAQMTTQQSADYLGISRPTLIKLLTDFEIPIQVVGRHRRISFNSVEELKNKMKSSQSENIRNLRRKEHELGLYDHSDKEKPANV